MPTIFMICGPVGAGKTTYALNLAKSARAIHFSIDEWMATLFAKDSPSPPDLQWALERTGRCDAQIWLMCRRILAAGVDVIVDLGFMKREHRDRFRATVRDVPAEVELHYVTADVETRRERVRARNRERPETFTIEVADSTFDWAEGWFEAPEGEELTSAKVIVNS